MLELNTLTEFNNTWKTQSPEQIALELASINFETHHNSDSYHFLVGENDFISPETGKLIRPEIKEDTFVQKKEKIVYENLYFWAKDNESGLSAWVSPPTEGLFPSTKIILHEIVKRGREKFVLNRAILADIKAEEAVDIANIFTAVSVNPEEVYLDPEKVRSKLFVIKEGMSVIDLLNLFVEDPELIEQIKSGQDISGRTEILQKAKEYSARIRAGTSSADLYRDMINDSFIGGYNISCPTTAPSFSEYSAGHSIIFSEYKRVENCGKCGVTIGKLIRKGYHCKSCGGEYQGC
ncbi:MAG: hypothetical protein Q7R43_06415 [Candidatus Daviesbacteria bacterium]|nr:hypothetical protein [Candidatus Daviesbacteria bacterium]